jgi:hypothetical protein
MTGGATGLLKILRMIRLVLLKEAAVVSLKIIRRRLLKKEKRNNYD